ncbi:hypothetical protein PoB_002521300 [Plakobranchus ocellatus]|uniref:Uncharacterized protein n=1 Tax=Plakobranchus ocellatus TaxID=259542 RepID=A0AAV3ZWA3_9GAST|nr:hypothetical protein PoB_002521300 [Plakobranchus ocellatus]
MEVKRSGGYQVRGPRFESQSRPSKFFPVSLCPPRSKGGAESKVKLPHDAVYAKNNQDPTHGFLMLELRVEPTLLSWKHEHRFHPLRISTVKLLSLSDMTSGPKINWCQNEASKTSQFGSSAPAGAECVRMDMFHAP